MKTTELEIFSYPWGSLKYTVGADDWKKKNTVNNIKKTATDWTL